MSDKRQMWNLHSVAKTYSQRPSALVGITDPWLALQFDSAVSLVGNVIENAAQEQHNTGTAKQPKYEPRYSMAQLLDDDFRLPAPASAKAEGDGLAALMRTKGVRTLQVKG